MKNGIVGLFLAVLSSSSSFAQSPQYVVRSGSKGLFLDHTVSAKEGLFSIGRIYSVHPKFIAAYNNLDMNRGLSIGQTIHIPLTDTNFNQSTGKGVPLYYVVGEKEGLLKVSNANNKVAMQKLREWNRLTSDNLSAGTKLIVGFLTSNEIATTAAAETKPVSTEPSATERKPEIKTSTGVSTPDPREAAKKPETVPAKQEVTSAMAGQGYFKHSFDQQVRTLPATKTETVTSGIFKTTSGWQDSKFYLLMDGVQSGTIIRVINPENNRTVYAKVLGEMSGIRQNQGLNIRISNAAASTLGIDEAEMDKFIVKINY